MDEIYLGVGTPSLSFIPARNYRFKIVSASHKIVVPVKGQYKDICEEGAPPIFDSEQSFCIYENGVVCFNTLNKVLFAMSLYPNLEDNTLFVLQNLYFSEDKIMLVGCIVKMISKEEYTELVEATEEDI